MFLAKYIPATPPPSYNRAEPKKRKSIGILGSPLKGSSFEGDDESGASPCPSPTPLFQQLYAAVSYWERMLAGSPELMREVLGKLSPDLGQEEEQQEREAQLREKRTASMHNLSVSGGSEREMSIRRRSSAGGLLAAEQDAKKKSEMNRVAKY